MRVKNFSVHVFLFMFLSCHLIAQERQGTSVTVVDPKSNQEIKVYEDSWAILIGINKYQFENRLEYAVEDAEAIQNLLIRKFKFNPDRVIFLKDEQATKANINNAFSKLLEAKEKDRILVYFAGHGTQFDLASGGETGFLVPVEGKAETISKAYSTCLSMSEIRTLATLISAKHILFLVDACYGGLSAMTSRALSHTTEQYLKKITTARARQIITGGGKGEKVIEKPEWGHSAFTYKLLDGLDKELADANGDRLITASELATYLKPNVAAASDNRQIPQFKAFTEDEGDFVFVLGLPKYTIDVSSIPSEASVLVDGKNLGLTPLKVELEQGDHQIEVTKGGFRSYKETRKIIRDETITAQLTEDVFELAITSNPSGGNVFFNGLEQGLTSLVVKLRPGKYTLEIEKEGFEKWSQEVNVLLNQSITATLKPISAPLPGPKTEPPKRDQTLPEKEPDKELRQLAKVQQVSNTLYWVLGGVAIVGFAAADYFPDKKFNVFGLFGREIKQTPLPEDHPRFPGQ